MKALDFSCEAAAEAVGMKPEPLAELGQLFEDQVRKKALHPAAQLVVARHGQVVLDRALGVERFAYVDHDTPFLVFSVTKPFTAMCILKLVEKGCLELDDPIARYWPEFGCFGKESATVRHALLHQAGIPAPNLTRQVPLWPFWGLVTRNVARTPAVFQPGSQSAYHLVNFGFILGEVVRRVSGQMVDVYLKQNFLEPLGLRHTTMHLPWSKLAATPALVAETREMHDTVAVFNLPPIRTALVPAATLHSTARELAVFYQMLLDGGTYAGRRYLKSETIEAATRLYYEGQDSYLQVPMRYGLGFQLGGTLPGQQGEAGYGKGSTARTFGHYGMGTCMSWADPDQDLVVTFTTNGMWDGEAAAARWMALCDLVWDAVL